MPPPTLFGAKDVETRNQYMKQGDVVEHGDGSESLASSSAPTAAEQREVEKLCVTPIRTSGQSTHQLGDRKKLLSCVRLLDAQHFPTLPRPLPRAQDVPSDYYHTPSVNDEVISISHAWRNQAHPDPTCKKTMLLSQLLSQIKLERAPTGGSMLLFLDFISIPQRPFQHGQEPRTEQERWKFRTALGCMHELFFFSDRIIHLPWDESEVAEEGRERTVLAGDLEGAPLAQTGDSVQISGPLPPKLAALGVQLFDQVVSVDGENATSMEQVATLLRSEGRPRSVRLRSYPYGLSSTIPADARGWVFLERFITMVKCAMMDEETANKVVITPSKAIFEQIMDGAACLRAASLQDQKLPGAGELKRALERFEEELQQKHFTPASTDMRDLKSSMQLEDDRSVVLGIMRQFVEHLAAAGQWEIEAVRQRGLAGRLQAVVAATESYLLDWNCFSEDYAARLVAASVRNPWPLVLLALWSTGAVLAILLAPYSRPDAGWREQTWFWAYGLPGAHVVSFLGGLSFVAATSGIRLGQRVLLRLAGSIALSIAVNVLAPLVLAAAFDLFPVPATFWVASPLSGALLPALWYCIPHDQRASAAFRKRLLCAAMAITVVMSVFSNAFPLLNAALLLVGTGWQAVLVTVYLASKLLFELLGVKLSHHLGADAIPYFVFLAAWNYQVNLCAAFSNVSSWLIIAEQITFDTVENVYHVWCIFRHSAEGPARHSQYILSSLVIREFVEILVPSIFLVILLCLKTWRPDGNTFLCKGERELQQTILFLQVDIAVEAVISCITCALLWRRGYKPLLLLRGLIATRLVHFASMAAGSFMYYLTQQHSHWGLDLSFKLSWALEEDAQWVCGLEWASAS